MPLESPPTAHSKLSSQTESPPTPSSNDLPPMATEPKSDAKGDSARNNVSKNSAPAKEVSKVSIPQHVEKREKEKQKSTTAAIVAAAAAEIERRRQKAPPAADIAGDQSHTTSTAASASVISSSSLKAAVAVAPAPPHSLDVEADAVTSAITATAGVSVGSNHGLTMSQPIKKTPAVAAVAKNVPVKPATSCPAALTPGHSRTPETLRSPASKSMPKAPTAATQVAPIQPKPAGKLSFGDVVRGAKPSVSTVSASVSTVSVSAPLSVDGDLPSQATPQCAEPNSMKSEAQKRPPLISASASAHRAVGPMDVGSIASHPSLPPPSAVDSPPVKTAARPSKISHSRDIKEVFAATNDSVYRQDFGACTPPNLTSPLIKAAKAIMSIDMHEDDDDDKPLIDATDCAVVTTPSFGPVAVSPQRDTRAPAKDAGDAVNHSFDAFMGMRQISLMMPDSSKEDHLQGGGGGEMMQHDEHSANAIDLAMFHMALTGNTTIRSHGTGDVLKQANSPLVPVPVSDASFVEGLSPVSKLDEVISQLSTAGSSPLPNGSQATPAATGHQGKPSPTNFLTLAELTRAVSSGALGTVASNLSFQLSANTTAPVSDGASRSTPASANEDAAESGGAALLHGELSVVEPTLPRDAAAAQAPQDDLQSFLTPGILTMLDDDCASPNERSQSVVTLHSQTSHIGSGSFMTHPSQHGVVHSSASGSFTVTSHGGMAPQPIAVPFGYPAAHPPSESSVAMTHMQSAYAFMPRQQPAPAYSQVPQLSPVSYLNPSGISLYQGGNPTSAPLPSTAFSPPQSPPLIVTPQGTFALMNLNGQTVMVPVVYQSQTSAQGLAPVASYASPPSPSTQPQMSQQPPSTHPHLSPSKRA